MSANINPVCKYASGTGGISSRKHFLHVYQLFVFSTSKTHQACRQKPPIAFRVKMLARSGRHLGPVWGPITGSDV